MLHGRRHRRHLGAGLNPSAHHVMTARGQSLLAPAGTSRRRKGLGRFGLCLLALLPGLLGAGIPSPAVSGAEFTALLRSADTVFIEYRDANGDRTSQISDPAWVAQLAEIVETGPLIPCGYCFCIGGPVVKLYRANAPLLRFELKHSTIWISGNVSGGFDLGPERWEVLRQLLMAPFASSQPHFAPPRIKNEKSTKPAIRPHPVQISLPSEPLWFNPSGS